MNSRSPLSLFAVAALALGCSGGGSEIRAEAKDLWSSLRAYGVEQSHDFVTQAERELQRVAGELDELDAEARATLQANVDLLRDELARLGDASGDTWREARDGIVERLEELDAELERHTEGA